MHVQSVGLPMTAPSSPKSHFLLSDFLNSSIALEGDAVMGMGTDLQDWFPSH